MVLTESRPHLSHETTTGPDFAYAAFWVLRVAFVALPLAVGIDKYFDHFVDWRQYLWSGIPNNLHISATTFMHIAGVVEIVAALFLLFLPQLGAAAETAWLAGIVANLVLVGFDEHGYWTSHYATPVSLSRPSRCYYSPRNTGRCSNSHIALTGFDTRGLRPPSSDLCPSQIDGSQSRELAALGRYGDGVA